MARAPLDPRRRCIKFEDWPERDKVLWRAGTQVTDDLDDPGYGGSANPRTLRKIAQGWGRYLGFLQACFTSDVDLAPSQRVTVDRLRTYITTMRDLGNRAYTVAGRLEELKLALRIMEPSNKTDWITHPNGISFRSRQVMTKLPREHLDSLELLNWGCQLMDSALFLPPVRRRVQYRDGLMIAILAARAPRLRATTAMRWGTHVIKTSVAYRLVFAAADWKTKRSMEYDLPQRLTPYVDRYLAVERRELLDGAAHDAFWVNWGGEPLGEVGVEKRIRWWSEKKFGKAFGPHRFRHAAGTSQARCDPTNPAAGAAMLGISSEVLQEHYIVGGQIEAANAHTADVVAARKATGTLARNIFNSERLAEGAATSATEKERGTTIETVGKAKSKPGGRRGPS